MNKQTAIIITKFSLWSLATIAALTLAHSAYAATFILSPASKPVNLGDTFSVNILMDTEGQAIDGVDVNALHYDPSLLSVSDMDSATTGVQIAAGALMPGTTYNSVNTSVGTIQFSQVSSTTGTNFGGVGVLASITFTALKAGAANVTFDFTPGSTIDTNVAALYSDALTAVTNGSYTLNSALDTAAPTVPVNLTANSTSVSSVTLSWTASTDPVVAGQAASGVAGYKIYRNSTQISTSATPTYNDSGLAAATGFSYTVAAYDSAGNTSAQTPAVLATTLANPDTTAPTGALTAPAAGALLSGTVTISATAADVAATGQVTSGLALLSILLDGSVYASSSTGSVVKTLDTTTLTNASHTFVAIARDNAGNQTTSSPVTVTVFNLSSAVRYPRTLTLTSLEGLSSLPANTSLIATVLSPSTAAVLETQTNLLPNAQNRYTVTFLSSNPQVVDIRIAVPGYLSAKLTSIDTTLNSASTVSLPQLLAGDFNADNTINSLDYSVLNSHYNQNYPIADINRDSLVNSLDYAILKNNWGKSGQ